jgi:hypothetical protein
LEATFFFGATFFAVDGLRVGSFFFVTAFFVTAFFVTVFRVTPLRTAIFRFAGLGFLADLRVLGIGFPGNREKNR